MSSFGTARRRIETAGFAITETVHEPLQRIHNHTHDYAAMVFVLRGSFEEQVGGRTLHFEPGNILFRPPRESHANCYGPSGTRCLIVAPSQEFFQRVQDISSVFDSVVWSNDQILSVLGNRIHNELLISDQASVLGVEGLFLELLARATRQADQTTLKQSPQWIEGVRELLHARFTETLRLDDVAASMNLHPVYVARVFRRHFGCSLGEYVRRLRVEAACRALADTQIPLVQIALNAGFCSQSHFSSVFRRAIGTTAVEYRRSFARSNPPKV